MRCFVTTGTVAALWLGFGWRLPVQVAHSHRIPITSTILQTAGDDDFSQSTSISSSNVIRGTKTPAAFAVVPVYPRHQQQQHHPLRPLQPKINAIRSIGRMRKNHDTNLTPLYDSTSPNNNNNNNNRRNDAVEKFGWSQRWASVQCLILGAVVGSIAQAPISLLHNLVINNINPIAHWEYDTDSSAVIGGLFAIVYRYCIREDTDNPQLPQGCISAMVLIRTLPQIKIPSYCTPVPLNCHHDDNILSQILPIQYLYILDDPNVLQQLFWCGLESTILFTVTAQMMDMAMDKNYIRRFPG